MIYSILLCYNNPSKITSIKQFLLNDDVIKAEIRWCLHSMIHHNLLHNVKSSIYIYNENFISGNCKQIEN